MSFKLGSKMHCFSAIWKSPLKIPCKYFAHSKLHKLLFSGPGCYVGLAGHPSRKIFFFLSSRWTVPKWTVLFSTMRSNYCQNIWVIFSPKGCFCYIVLPSWSAGDACVGSSSSSGSYYWYLELDRVYPNSRTWRVLAIFPNPNSNR